VRGSTPKSLAKRRKRATVEDRWKRPKEPRSIVQTEAEQAAIVAFRRHTLLPPDDCLHTRQPSIPKLAPSALYRAGDGIQYPEQPRNRTTFCPRHLRFDMIYAKGRIEPRLAQPTPPLGQWAARADEQDDHGFDRQALSRRRP
jgi:hypothetical protein